MRFTRVCNNYEEKSEYHKLYKTFAGKGFRFHSFSHGKIKILYLSLPVEIYYSIVPDRFKIGFGVTNYFIAYSSQIKK